MLSIMEVSIISDNLNALACESLVQLLDKVYKCKTDEYLMDKDITQVDKDIILKCASNIVKLLRNEEIIVNSYNEVENVFKYYTGGIEDDVSDCISAVTEELKKYCIKAVEDAVIEIDDKLYDDDLFSIIDENIKWLQLIMDLIFPQTKNRVMTAMSYGLITDDILWYSIQDKTYTYSAIEYSEEFEYFVDRVVEMLRKK